MSIEWMDNFSQYGTSTARMADGLWADVPGSTLVVDPDGVSGGHVLKQNGAFVCRRVFGSTLTAVGTAFRLFVSALPTTNDSHILGYKDIANAAQNHLRLYSTGVLAVYRGSSPGTLIGQTTVPVIAAGAWYHIEVSSVCHDTAGSYVVKVNGVTVLNFTNVDTKATALTDYSQLTFGQGYGSPVTFYVKDIIAWNTSGTQNNDFMGDCQVVSLIPDGDDTLNWTPSAGLTGYNLIDETSPDDTDYLSADPTPPAASIFTLTDLDPEIVTVKGLMTVARQFKTDGGTAQTQVSLVSGASTDDGADRPITTDATCWTDLSELDPDTGAAWTPTAVNAVKLKINRTV